MRLLVIVLFISIGNAACAQSFFADKTTGFAVGISGGYSTKETVIGNISLGAMLPAGNHISANLVVPGKVANENIPGIFEGRAGHFFNTVEVYAGAGVRIPGAATTDMETNKSTTAKTTVSPAYGVIKHFYNSPWTVSAGVSEKIFSVQLGVFFIR